MSKRRISTEMMAKILILIFIIIFFIDTFLFPHQVLKWGAVQSHGKEYWQVITASLIHANILHLVGNCFMLWYLGNRLQAYLTGIKLLIIFMIANIITYIVFMNIWTFSTSVGASPGIYACIGVWFVSLRKRHILRLSVWKKPDLYYVALYLGFPQLLGFASWFVHGLGFLIGILIGIMVIEKTTRV